LPGDHMCGAAKWSSGKKTVAAELRKPQARQPGAAGVGRLRHGLRFGTQDPQGRVAAFRDGRGGLFQPQPAWETCKYQYLPRAWSGSRGNGGARVLMIAVSCRGRYTSRRRCQGILANSRQGTAYVVNIFARSVIDQQALVGSPCGGVDRRAVSPFSWFLERLTPRKPHPPRPR